MTFYIGNFVNEVDNSKRGVEVSDELYNFIWKVCSLSHKNVEILRRIDPYSDVEIPQKHLQQLIEICNCIIDSSLLQDYDEPDDGKQSLRDLVDIAQKAISTNTGLVSIGD